VFDAASGALLDDPDIEAIYAIRQLTLTFSKIALPEEPHGPSSVVSPQRERRAMSDFIQCEHDVKRNDSLLDTQFLEHFKRVSNLLFGELFAKVDRDIHWGRLTPKHGPGSVADRLTYNGKFRLHSWPARLERVMPAREYLAKRDAYDIVEPGSEMPVRVITVPKTLKAPRVIAIEPTAMQYAQQAVKGAILDAMQEDSFLSRIIGFDDQDPNREMAKEGSSKGNLATLDLSEASDRVSNQHVRALIDDYPQLLEAVDGCRSRKADVPGHGVIRLAKFASMGSALCFPFEALVFTTIIFMGIERELSAPLCPKTIHSFKDQVRVFGDDLIVPRDYVLSVVDELHTFGYVVNTDKSFWTGRFRESCGREYFDGHDVSIVKVRKVFPTRQTDARGVNSLVELRNQLYLAGLWQSARFLDGKIRKLLNGYFPNTLPSSPLMGRTTFLGYQSDRVHASYQSPLAKGYYLVPRTPKDPLGEYAALLKCLLRLGRPSYFGLPKKEERLVPIDVASVDTEHLERTGRPESVSIKLGWKSAI
jgi:hypothetical protein